ncbi:unnamed protein product [Closterium sp. NIES-65]|nr:unnamed protein product [Closterium sp. NIES-65]
MATLNVLAFDPDGRPIEFATWLDDLQLFLMTNAKDGVSLFDHASGTSVAPADTAAAFDRSQWQTRDAAARLAIRNHLPITERAHFSQHKIAKALYEAVVAFYSSLATATPGRLMLPYLFPDLSSFTTADDLISHLRATDARLRAALPAEFLVENHPPMYFTLYFLITRLPDTLRSVRDHFIALDPHSLTLDDFEKHLLTAEKNILAVAPGATGVVGEVEVAVEGAVVEAVGEVEVVGVVVGVEVVVGMAVVPGAVAVAATVVGEEGVVVAAVVGAGVEPARRGAPVVAKGSSSSSSSRSSVSARPPRLSNFRTVLAHSSTVLPCPVVPFGELSGLHLPSFSTNLGRQGAAPHSSSFPPIEAPLQILLLDVWGPARVRGQGHKRYFLLVVDNYTPYCEEHDIRQTFALSASPKQNGVAERHIGLVMEVAHTSMFHVVAPHFLWPYVVRADKLSSRAIPYVFLGFPPDAPGWQFYDPASRRVFASQDVTFDESVPFYRLFPYRTAPLPPPAALSRSRSSPGRPLPRSKSCSFRCVSRRPSSGD